MTENDEKRTREDQEMEDIDSYLSGIEPGYTVIIQRLEPMFAKGLLDEVSVDATQNPINLKYLINTWGGHKLRLKFRRPNGTWAKHRDINLYSFPPLLYGVPIKKEMSPHEHQQGDENTLQAPYTPPYTPPPPPQQNNQKEWLEMMMMMQKLRADDMQALSSLIQAQRQEPQPQMDPFRLLQGAFGLFSQFQAMRTPLPEKGDDDEVLGLLGKAVDVFQSTMKPAPESRITPPASPSPGINPDPNSLPYTLSAMDPKQTILTLRQAVGQMDPNKQAELMGELIGSIENIGGVDLLLDQLEARGILGDDEEISQDDNSEGSGRQYGPNEGDHTDSRPSD